ncbi:MAG: peptidoglycan DD-metalloendopeptidase family protein [Pseudonocardiaceae bacterium]|nr:peptidoglycan DD-metalloendopeptidase family protein [Pseudonocardiaceae bacterium]
MVAAVAVGAVTAAAQGLDPAGGDKPADTTLLAFGGDAAAGFTGVGGAAPAPGVLPLPDVMPVTQDSGVQDVASLAKGQQLAEERAAAEREAAEQAAAERAAAEREAAADGASQLPVSAGEVVRPASGELTSGFGSRWGSSHNGIDIANEIGTPIYSTTDGIVVESGPASGFGMWVQVEHPDDTISVYGHIHDSLVSEGQQVKAGEQIATMGNRGQSTGPHLHFEIWQNGDEKINPLSWLQQYGVDI